MNLVQPVILKKIKEVFVLRHIQPKPSQRKKKVAVYDFTKGGTYIVDQLNDYYTIQAKTCR